MRNELVEEDGRIVARPTGEREVIEAGIVFRSVGYQGVELPGVPFDAAARDDPERQRPSCRAQSAPSAPGWIKRGPSGVIGTNKKDATETVEELLADARAGQSSGARARPARSTRCSRAGALPTSSTPAGRRSTPPSGRPASRSAGRA